MLVNQTYACERGVVIAHKGGGYKHLNGSALSNLENRMQIANAREYVRRYQLHDRPPRTSPASDTGNSVRPGLLYYGHVSTERHLHAVVARFIRRGGDEECSERCGQTTSKTGHGCYRRSPRHNSGQDSMATCGNRSVHSCSASNTVKVLDVGVR